MEDFLNNPKKVQEDVPNFFMAKNPQEADKNFGRLSFAQKIAQANIELENSAINGEKNLFEKILAKFFPKIYKIQKIKSALTKLDNLNKAVREMVEKNTDDETQDKHYKILSNYINEANEIQIQLKKEI